MKTLDLPLALPPMPLSPASMEDDALVTRLSALAQRERELRATFIVHLAEFDRRRLYLQLGFPSLFAWLTERCRLSNASAFRRVTACRLHARMPAVGAYLREGRLSLNKLCQLRDLLAPENCMALLEQAASLSEKEVEKLAVILGATMAASPRDSIRPLAPPKQESLFAGRLAHPERGTSVAEGNSSTPITSVAEGNSSTPITSVAEVTSEPVTPALRHVVKMTVGPEFLALLERARAAFSHHHVRGQGASLEPLLLHCMKTALREHDKRSRARTSKPRTARQVAPGSRHILAHVCRAVWERDDGRCTFVSQDGARCTATHRIELHHTVPCAHGGPATEANIVLRCKAHNDVAARVDFGDAHMNRFTRRAAPLSTGVDAA